MHERHNSIANTLELCLSCTNPSILMDYYHHIEWLTHWGRVTHICISKLIINGSDNGLLPVRRQAIIWTNAGISLIWCLGTNFSEMLIETHAFLFKKMHLKMLSGKWQPFCLCLNVLTQQWLVTVLGVIRHWPVLWLLMQAINTDKTDNCQISNISHTKSQTYMFLISSCSCLFPIHWSQV